MVNFSNVVTILQRAWNANFPIFKNFAKFEVEKNRELLLTVNNLLQEAKDEVSKLIRSKAAAKKYK